MTLNRPYQETDDPAMGYRITFAPFPMGHPSL